MWLRGGFTIMGEPTFTRPLTPGGISSDGCGPRGLRLGTYSRKTCLLADFASSVDAFLNVLEELLLGCLSHPPKVPPDLW